MKSLSNTFIDLLPTLKAIEKERRKLLRQSEIVFFIAIGALFLGILAMIFVSMITNDNEKFLVGGFFAFVILICIIIHFMSRYNLKNQYKDKIIPQIINGFDNTFIHSPYDHIDTQHFKDSQLYKQAGHFNGQDHISGYYNGLNFEFSELHAYNYANRGKRSHKKTIFRGLFLVFDVPVPIENEIYILTDSTGEDWLGRMFKNAHKGDYRRVILEDTRFENAFDTYTINENAAIKILSPMLKEYLYKLQHEHYNIRIAINSSIVYVAINWGQQPFLEPKINKTLMEEATLELYLKDLRVILEIIENFKELLPINHISE